MDPSVDTIQCSYKRSNPNNGQNPHNSLPFRLQKKVYDDALDALGLTPMVRLNKIPQSLGVKCEILVKCEFLNMGGSVKDRIGMRMILDAEAQNRIKKGDTLIEATSGNTGVGMALAAAVKGYKMIITMPEKMSQEKQDVLTGLGAQVIRTPTEAAWDAPDSHLSIARKLQAELPNAHFLDQYSNPSNPMAHYEGTGEEIIYQTDGKINAVVLTVGTGGTITGVGRKIHEKVPGCQVVGVDPLGSILAMPQELNKTDITTYKVEGIGYDFIPKVLDRSEVDHWIKSTDEESLLMARRLISEEGLLCGGSSGAALAAAIQYAKEKNLTEQDRIVVILPDNIRNYLTKHLSKFWMIENGLLSYDELKEQNHPLSGRPVSEIKLPEIQSFLADKTTIGDCLEFFKTNDAVGIPIIQQENDSKIFAVVFQKKLLAAIMNKKLQKTDPALKAWTKEFVAVPNNLDQNQIERLLERNEIIFVIDQQKGAKNVQFITPKILLNFLAQ